MSRRRSLVGVLPQDGRQLILFGCVLSLLLPSVALAAKRSKVTATTKAIPSKASSSKASPAKGSAAKAPATKGGSKAVAKKSAAKTSPGKRSAGKRIAGPPGKQRARAGKRRAARTVRKAASRSWRTVRREPEAPVYGSRGTVDEHVHLRRGDTLERVLALRGVDPMSTYEWFDAAQGVYDLRQVRPRRGVTLRFDRATRRLDSVRYEIDDDELLVLERDDDGERITARREALPYVREIRAVAGRIARGMREDTMQAGVPPSVAASLADIFGWELDVTVLDPGDEFRVIYENIWETGRPTPLTGNIIAAEIISRGYKHTAVFFEDDQGSGYYRPDGQAVSRAFLRFPVEFTEITSEFSWQRFHPILHRGRPHLGVDLAAPTGTPVRAAASGWVSQAGWSGGLGRSVRLEHAGELSTTYGHLTEISPSVRENGVYERCQIIGYVGSTGLANGPHLHYEFEQAGQHVDPLTVNVALDPPVAEPVRRSFDRVRSTVMQQLARLPITDRATQVSLSANAFRTE